MAGQEQAVARATAGSERIDILDALRGLALLGILLANVEVFFGWVILSPQQRADLSGAGTATLYAELIKFFIDGKFYTIFSLLFGIGFTLQLDRLEKRGAAGARVFRRRMLVLLAIGLCHLCFIWFGDILSLYAALGLALPLFRHWPERRVLVTAIVLLALPLVAVPLLEARGVQPGKPLFDLGGQMFAAIDGKPAGSDIENVQRTDWRGFMAWQLTALPYRLAFLLDSWRIPKVLGVMLLGMVAGRRLIAGTLLDDRRLLGRIAVFGLVVGVPCNWVYARNLEVYQEHWSSVIGTVPLGLAYAAMFALAWPRAKAVLRHFAPVGRMALTNYLTHSIIGLLLLGPFLNLCGRVGPVAFSLAALALYAAQILFSRWWLARHEQGPMERLWRWGTYGSVKTR
ncbi:MAG: DUF418 domain-containing protein [Novosphingobium sp.]